MESEMCMKSLGSHNMCHHFSILMHDHIEIHAVLVPGKGEAGGYMIRVIVVHCHALSYVYTTPVVWLEDQTEHNNGSCLM